MFLPELALWLDPHHVQNGPGEVFVSHAHSDHIGAHREVIFTEPTSDLMEVRLRKKVMKHVLPLGQPRQFGGDRRPFSMTLLPAGHILGSAMAFVEWGNRSLLYTGDFKLRANLSAGLCDPAPARGCDFLVMETTFGRPKYRFPAAEGVMEDIVRFCRAALDEGAIPVLLAYSLGKSQELLCGLEGAGLPIMLHDAVWKMVRIYKRWGVRFPPHERFRDAKARGKVLVFPPQAARSPRLQALGKIRTAIISGWAIDPSCRFRYRTDAAFPLSDHADYPELVELVQRLAPRKVFTLHGFAADFAQSLRELGFDAQALSEPEQLRLAL